ncbi:MAG: hypothetical protein PHW04_07785, partial [Candidatus Wallbacteria bacterium]|nr:hypothetical protein [Candidatus Wallbacteria bacterium]
RDVWNSADGKNWTQVTNQGPFSARFGTCAAYDGRLWLSCGKTTGGGTVADVWYTKDGVSWTQAVSTGLTSRYCHSMTAFNGSLWIIAGSTGSAPYLNDTWNYYDAPVFGQLTVQLNPEEAVSSGAGWRLVGETGWRDSGTNAQVQEGDGYKLEFRQTGGYCTPNVLKGVMPIDGTAENVTYAEYNQILSHNLTVTILPSGAVFSGAGWRLSGENLWRGSGSSVSLIEGSTCTVEYRDVIGYSQPESVHGTMEAGDISVPCIYQAVPWTQGQTAGFGGRYGHGNIVLNGKMFVIGGYDGTYRHDVWSTIDGLTWTKECDAPFSSRYLFGCTVHEGKIWIAGGNANTVLKSDVWQSADGKNWTQVTADGGFTARSAAGLVSFDGKLWLIGGCITGGASRNDVWSSVDGITWTKECDAPFTSRFCHGTEVYANKIWVVGGYTTTNNTYLKDVWNSSDGKIWTQVSSQNPFSVRYGTCSSYNGRLWLSCGKTYGDTTVADIWYTKDGVNWTQAYSTGLSPRYCHSMTPFNGSLWIIAGSTGTTPYLNDTWSYYEAPVLGQLTVQLNPADAVASGAGWRLTGESGWRNSGTSASVQESDGYRLEFRQTGGYCTPNVLKGVMPINGTTENVTYIEYNQNLSHNLTVAILPSGAVSSGAGWKLSGENLWRSSGASVSLNEGSSYIVEYRDIVGYSQPEITYGTMEAGDVTVTCTYQPVSWTQGQTAGFGGRYGHGSVVLNGKLFVIGGYDGTYRRDIWSTGDGIAWTKECDAPFTARYSFGCTVHNGKIWIAGGGVSTGVKADVWQSADGKNWTQVTADGGYGARNAVGLESFGGKLWLIGGCITGGASKNDIWSSVNGVTWTKECDAPFISRYCMGTAVYANKIWVVGGYTTTNNTYLKDAWNSSDGMNWTQVSGSQNPFSVRFGTCTAYDGRLWLSCGKTTGGTTVADVWYTKDGVNWIQAPTTGLSPRYCHTMTAFNNSLWIIAGSTGTTPYLNDTWCYFDDPDKYLLSVTITPSAAITAGAGWSIDGGNTWKNSGESPQVAADTTFEITFKNVTNYVTPAGIAATMENDIQETGNYLPVYGALWHQINGNAEFSPRYGAGAAAFINELWVTGGFNGTAYYSDVWHSVDGISWNQATESAGFTPRYGHSCLSYNGMLWVIAGFSSTGLKNDVWCSADGITWTQAIANAGFTSRYGQAGFIFNGKMWVTAGYDYTGSFKNDVWYTTDGTNWTQAAGSAAFAARASLSGTVFANRAWLIGGMLSLNSSADDVWSSIDGINWLEAVSSASIGARSAYSLASFNRKLWIVGGIRPDHTMLSDIWESENGLNWIRASEFSGMSARCSHQLLYFNNKMWIIAGNDGIPRNDVWYSELESPAFPVNLYLDSTEILVPLESEYQLPCTAEVLYNGGTNEAHDITWSLTTGGGTLNGNVYTAPAVADTAELTATYSEYDTTLTTEVRVISQE